MNATTSTCGAGQGSPRAGVAQPHDLSPRAAWLRDYYFQGSNREWTNEYSPFTTGTPHDRVFNEIDYYIVPELYFYLGKKTRGPFATSLDLMAKLVALPAGFWDLSLPERRARFFQEVMVHHVPHEIISDNDLLAGGRFNTQLSKCLDAREEQAFNKEILRNRKHVFSFHEDGFGNAGATGGHLIVDYALVVREGFKSLHARIKASYEALSEAEKRGPRGEELRAMLISVETPREVAKQYALECRKIAAGDGCPPHRKAELEQMARNLEIVPWEPARTFWQGLQAVWLTHMLVIAEESYPGPGVSFGRLDQYLWPLYERDVITDGTLDAALASDIFSSFIFHCNTAYDAQIRIGNNGITAGFGQLMTLSGMGADGQDLTNELTYMILDTFDRWAPILEPKPNIRLHRNSPDRLLDVVVAMIARSQGAPFILNFDEKSIAGLVLEGIPPGDAWDYGCVGCLENTMCGNDRSGTVNCNPNLAKSIELVLWNGKNMPGVKRATAPGKQLGPVTGDPATFPAWGEFYDAWKRQVAFIIQRTVEVYNYTEATRARFLPTPYVSILVDDCIEKGVDIRRAPPKIGFVTIEGVGFATMVDSLLAIKHLVYDEKRFSIDQVKDALLHDFQGTRERAIIQAMMVHKTPKYGNDDDAADALARDAMAFWAGECWHHRAPTGYQFRPGMLSWNYWAGEDAALTPATPNGRRSGTFLSNAICPTNGADTRGPTAVTNSVGTALGGKDDAGSHVNVLPNGASHTITFNPALFRDAEHREKFKAYLRGYVENGGTALQVNVIDAAMLEDAQRHPREYSNLLVRITGYNAYFTSIGKELQDEIIAREMHRM